VVSGSALIPVGEAPGASGFWLAQAASKQRTGSEAAAMVRIEDGCMRGLLAGFVSQNAAGRLL
jgi:hypothetical protein